MNNGLAYAVRTELVHSTCQQDEWKWSGFYDLGVAADCGQLKSKNRCVIDDNCFNNSSIGDKNFNFVSWQLLDLARSYNFFYNSLCIDTLSQKRNLNVEVRFTFFKTFQLRDYFIRSGKGSNYIIEKIPEKFSILAA